MSKYVTAAFEGKCIQSFGLKGEEHDNSSKYRVKNWKEIRRNETSEEKKSLVWQKVTCNKHTFKVVFVQHTVSDLKILFPCHEISKFLVPHVLKYFATQSITGTHL